MYVSSVMLGIVQAAEWEQTAIRGADNAWQRLHAWLPHDACAAVQGTGGRHLHIKAAQTQQAAAEERQMQDADMQQAVPLTSDGNSAGQDTKEYVEGWGQRWCCWCWPVRLSCQC